MSERSRQRAGRRVALLSGACLALGAAGCISTPTKSPLMEQADNLVDITSVQLRGQLYDFTSRYATVIEGAADRIIAATDDPAVRERALIWKIEAIPGSPVRRLPNSSPTIQEELEALSQRRIADIDQQRIESIAVLRAEREILVQVVEA